MIPGRRENNTLNRGSETDNAQFSLELQSIPAELREWLGRAGERHATVRSRHIAGVTLKPRRGIRQLLDELGKQTEQPAKYASNVYHLTAKVFLKNSLRNDVKLETGLTRKA